MHVAVGPVWLGGELAWMHECTVPVQYRYVNSFKETRQSKQLHPKTTPFFSREKMSCLRICDVLRARQTLYQLSHRGSSAGQAESLKFMQGKERLSPDGQGNQS